MERRPTVVQVGEKAERGSDDDTVDPCQ